MRRTITSCAILVLLIGTANAEQCPPGSLGVSRTLVVDPNEHARVGSIQYPETLPLNDHEVMLTFDDGPLPRYTNPVLETLASECVKATFFMVGQMARAYPWMVRRVYDEGHTVANHTQNHPFAKCLWIRRRARSKRVLSRCARPSGTRRRCRLSFGYRVCCARSRSRAPIATVGAADAVIPVDPNDLTAHADGDLAQFALLVGRGLIQSPRRKGRERRVS